MVSSELATPVGFPLTSPGRFNTSWLEAIINAFFPLSSNVLLSKSG
jgi:cytochrome bd-type quinol oxidase subunit 1